jgi:hypothetical protein
MPLLSELREFKASFANLGGQKANLAAKKIPINDLKLPDTEAEPMTEAEPVDETAAFDTSASDVAGGIDDLNFSDFINALPGDLSVPEPDIQEQSVSAEDTFSPPDELLSDLPNELGPVPPADSLESDSGSNLDTLDNLEKFNFPDPPATPASADAPAPADAHEDAFAQADDDGALDLSVFDDLGDFGNLSASNSPGTSSGDLPDEPAADAADTSAGESETPSDLDALGDFDLPEEPAATAADTSAGEGETPDFSDLDLPEEPAADAADTSAGESETPSDLDALGDFDLPEEPAAAVADSFA